MRKSFVLNITFLILVNLIVKPFWVLGIDRNVQNTVGHEVYGIYQAMFNITIIFQILLDFGLQAYNSRIVAQTPAAMRSLFVNIFVVKILFAFLYLGVIVGYGLWQGFEHLSFKLLLILSLMQIALSFLTFFRSNIAAMQKFKTDSLFSIFDRLIAIIILVVLLFSVSTIQNPFQIDWYAWVQLIAYVLTGIAAFFVCRNLQKIEWKHFKFKKIWEVILQSVPYAVLIFLMAVYMRIDVILLENISSDSSIAGRYAASFRLLDVSNNMSGVLIAGILLPLFSKMIAQKENFRFVVNLSINIMLPFAICLSVLCAFWGYDILNLLYKDIRPEDGQVIFWLMCSFPLYCINYIYATLLTANGNIKALIILSAIAVLLTIGLNLALLSENNSLNAVITARNTFIIISVVAISNLLLSHRILRASWSLKQLIQFIAFTILLIGISYFLYNNTNHWHLYLKMLVVISSSLLLILVTGIINIKTAMQQIKKLFAKR